MEYAFHNSKRDELTRVRSLRSYDFLPKKSPDCADEAVAEKETHWQPTD
jgi:hypothetical protein